MPRPDLKGKRVVVLGLGSRGGGVGAVKFLVGQGARVLISDQKEQRDLPSLGEVKNLPVDISLGKNAGDVFPADLIIRNPAVPGDSSILKEAKNRGVPIWMESTLFFTFCPTANVIGVTGTKGKTTLTFWLTKALSQAGCSAFSAGYPGSSMLSLLPKLSPPSYGVLELSSFQLEGLAAAKASPRVAVITSLFADHLDRYRTMREYIRAKSFIFRYQAPSDYLFLGAGVPDCLRDFDIYPRKFLLKGREAHETGPQILENLGIEGDFSKLRVDIEYRRQKVGERDGVSFVNDSCATNPGATLFSLVNMEKVVLIAGGTDKNLDYRKLGLYLTKQKIPLVLLSGSATEKLKAFLLPKNILGEFSNLSEAVRVAFAAARKRGSDVLFSPASASFELFKDENERGERFTREVQSL